MNSPNNAVTFPGRKPDRPEPGAVRIPPHSIEAEQAVLGGLMLSERAFERVADRLAEADFYRRDHQIIFRAIAELAHAGKPCDAVTLGEWFESRGHADQVGGSGYVLELASTTPSAANIRAYADIVREKSVLRRMIDIGTRIIELGFDPEGRASGEIVDAAIAKLMRLQQRDQRAEWPMRDVLKLAFERVQHAFEHPGELPGIPTGLTDLDRHLGGLHPSDLTVFAGRPSMGKTALLFGAARHAATTGVPVGIVSAEMSATQFGLRMLSLSSGVKGYAMRSGKLDDQDWSRISGAIKRDYDLPIVVFDQSAPSVIDVARVARAWKREHGIKALYVDYIQRLGGPGKDSIERVGAVVKGLKTIARDLDIAVVALSQVNRKVEERTDKRPHMSDLSDSSQIEKEADQVVTIYRDDYYTLDKSQKPGVAELRIEKNRHGEGGYVDVAWLAGTMRFADLDTREA